MMDQKISNWIKTTLHESGWAPLCIFVFYILALTVHLFDLLPILDVPSHFIGAIAITYFYRSAIRNSGDVFGETPYPIQVWFAFTLTGTTTILWELYELTLDFFLDTNKIRGLEDTLTDLFVGLMGAFVFSVFYRHRN